MKKLLAVTIMILFFSVSVIQSTGTTDVKQITVPTAKGDTLYVGGSGPGNYSKIQDAIDDASDGDTVFVYNGTYYENLIVNKTVYLTGEDRNSTIIDGNEGGDVVYISADWVNISGLTIRNSGLGPGDAGIDIHSNSNTLSDNIISYNGQGPGSGGILIWGSISNNSITGNNISNNYAGICLSYSSSNIITGNSILHNTDGVEIWDSNYNIIMCNNITSNSRGGICLDGSSNNIITDNKINSNNKEGLLLDESSNNNITGNNIQNNHIWGMIVSYSVNNIIEKNNFIGHIRHVNIGFSNRNTWNENYWDNWIGIKIKLPIFQKFPKIIFGFWLYPIPFPPIPVFSFAFDRNPAQEPYDIGV